MKRIVLLTAVLVTISVKEGATVELKASPINSQHRKNLNLLFSIESGPRNLQATSTGGQSVEQEGRPEKSIFKAGLYSALIPGGGEYYLGHKGKARAFFTVEALNWVGFAAFRIYGGWKKDDFIRFADERAGANLSGKDDVFFDMVGFYDDIDQYNSLGRAFDPDRAYLEDNVSNHWRWQSENDQATYRHLKNKSREAYRRSNFMIGLAMLNRVISIIDAVRDAKRSRHKLDTSDFGAADKLHYKFELNPFSCRKQVSFTFFTPF